MPVQPRIMVFIDGENIVSRYEDMLSKGWEPDEDNFHIPKVAVWRADALQHRFPDHQVIRVSYYTSVRGDDEQFAETRAALRKVPMYGAYIASSGLTLFPVLLRRFAKERYSKGVDIQICVDVLTHVHANNVDTVILATGDGDFEPLIREVTRSGKQLVLAAFTDGLSPRIRDLADDYDNLNHVFFSGAPKST